MHFSRRACLGLAIAALGFAIALRPASANESAGPPTPDPQDLIDLVRNTVLAVDAGNASGDYKALFEMGSMAFQDGNPADRLSEHFSRLRARKLDMSVVRTMTPLTTRPPTMDRNGLLRILGFFEIGRVQLVYDLLYDYDFADQRWRVAAVSLNPRDIAEPPKLIQPQ